MFGRWWHKKQQFCVFCNFFSFLLSRVWMFLLVMSVSQSERERKKERERDRGPSLRFYWSKLQKRFSKNRPDEFLKKVHKNAFTGGLLSLSHTQPDTQPVGWKMSEATEISGRGGSLWRQWQVFQTRIWSSKMMPRYLLLLKQNYLNYLGNGDYHTYLSMIIYRIRAGYNLLILAFVLIVLANLKNALQL